jgi:anti-sigma B factor antagonist
MDLGLSTSTSGPFTVLTVTGEIDLATAPLLQRAFDELGQQDQLVVDLSEVTFLDSTGIGVLINGRRDHAGDGALRIVSTQPSIAKLFALTGLTDVFPIYPTLDEALA